MKELIIDGSSLTIEQVAEVALKKIPVKIKSENKKKLIESRKMIEEIVKSGEVVYGINTGFGALSSEQIKKEDLTKLQYHFMRSHCTGVGDPFDETIVRAIMLIRENCLISGYSGITPDVVYLLNDFLNKGIIPFIPSKGSVGASGDLAPLAHLGLCLIGEGDVFYNKKLTTSKNVLKKLGLSAASLGPKDGLALTNGTSVMASLGSLAVYDAKHLMKMADIIGALTIEGLHGTKTAFDKDISALKPHPGQVKSAHNLRRLLVGSEILKSHKECNRVQDPYSLRCMPQVHGACRQTVKHAEEVISIELNAVTDNPLCFPKKNKIISGGNFHGEALALCMDYLAMGMAEFASITERRIEKMTDPTFSHLPAFLVDNPGLNSGFMIAHVTAAALASENKVLCHPASVDSIPTSTDKEDHVSMGITAGLKLHQVIKNLKFNMAIELLCNSQAIDYRRPHKTSKVLEKVFSCIREAVPKVKEDRAFYKDINKLVELIESRKILEIVEGEIGELD